METVQKKRKPYTVLLDDDLRRRISEVVYWTPGMCVADFMEHAVLRELQRLKHAKGRRFKSVPGKLKRGKPPRLKN